MYKKTDLNQVEAMVADSSHETREYVRKLADELGQLRALGKAWLDMQAEVALRRDAHGRLVHYFRNGGNHD